MGRRTDLLFAAAKSLEEGADPFHRDWLGEHDVSADECMNMARLLAIGARVVARGLDDPKSAQGVGMIMSMAQDAGD